MSAVVKLCYLRKGLELGSPEYFNNDQAICPEDKVVDCVAHVVFN